MGKRLLLSILLTTTIILITYFISTVVSKNFVWIVGYWGGFIASGITFICLEYGKKKE